MQEDQNKVPQQQATETNNAPTQETNTTQQPMTKKRGPGGMIRLVIMLVLVAAIVVIIAGIISGLNNTVTVIEDQSCDGYNCMHFEATQEDGFATWEVQPGWPLFLTVSGSAGEIGDDVTIRCPNRQDSNDLMAKLAQLFDREATQECRVI